MKLVERLRAWLWPKPKLSPEQTATLKRADRLYKVALEEIRKLDKAPH